MRVVLAAATLAGLVGCSAARSTAMTPTTAVPSGPAPDSATILFVGNLRDAFGGGLVHTIYDEDGTFVGDLADVSAFEVRVAPGRHTFCSLPVDDPDDLPQAPAPRPAPVDCATRGLQTASGVCFGGDYAPGKYYVAWLRYSNEGGQGAIAGWRKRWLFPHPGSKTLDARGALEEAARLGGLAAVPLFVPDVPRGQRQLDAHPPALCATPFPEEDMNPASWGWDGPP